MHHYMNNQGGWSWFWMVPMMLLWIAVLGGVIYGAVRLARKHPKPPPFGQ